MGMLGVYEARSGVLMPAALADVDWTAVRLTYAATGSFATTARAHGIDDATVRQHAKRGGWKEQREMAIVSKDGVSRDVTKPAPHVAMRNALSEMGEKIRIKGEKCAKKGLDAVYKLDGDKIAIMAGNVKSLIDAGEKAVVGWGGGASQAPVLRLELIAGARAELPELPPELDIPMEVTPLAQE